MKTTIDNRIPVPARKVSSGLASASLKDASQRLRVDVSLLDPGAHSLSLRRIAQESPARPSLTARRARFRAIFRAEAAHPASVLLSRLESARRCLLM